MYLNRITAVLSYLFGYRPRPALCPARVRVVVRSTVVMVAIMSARGALATVAQTGNVFPADNPFTLGIDEGIPDGNSWNIFEAVDHQTFFEGRHSDGANPDDPLDDTNVNFDITVGRTSFGSLLISGESALRDQTLIIGDKGTVGTSSVERLGTGVVRITQFGSVYNNDPLIVPAEVENVPGFKSVNPRSPNGNGTGFDLIVGRWGTGTLEITAGARAEIQDAVLVGDNPGAVGNLLVDGIDSFLGNGGSVVFPSSDVANPHLTIIGRQGTGNLTISNGATMTTQVSTDNGSQQGTVALSLGSSPYTLVNTTGLMPAGGKGTATITGNGSKFTIGGSLQIGGFDLGEAASPTATSGDLEGDDTVYGSQAGRGTLYVNGGGLVDVQYPVGTPLGGGNQTPLVMAIGRFGIVQLGGSLGAGTINVGSPLGGTQDQATPNAVQLINDGVITGTGRINTGVFRNRYLGQVRVEAGQSLVIDSAADFLADTGGVGTPQNEPLSNFGTIEVIGNSQVQAQLEFVRSPSESTDTTTTRPFVNLPIVTDPPPTLPAFGGGLISAQYSKLRFGSGLQNQSLVTFTAGMNYVSGKVVNLALDPLDTDDGDAGDSTEMLVSGRGTTAVFEDDLAFGSQAHLNLVDGGNVVVLNQHSFTLSGDLSISLSYSNPSLVTVAGDVGIGQGTTDLSLNLDADVLQSLKHGDAFKIIAYGGDIGNVDLTDPFNPTPNLTAAPIFADVDVSPNVFQLYGLVPHIVYDEFSNPTTQEGVYVVFLDPTMVGPPGGPGAIAPDFNGDGVVDLADYAIWKSHVGQMSGASVLDGDADGDGDVDGADFLKWQRNAGKPMPWTGSGSGSGSSVASVPEPASLMMLAFGGTLALAFGRRRSSR